MDYEGMSAKEYFQGMEEGKDAQGDTTMMEFDMSSTAHASDTDAQKEAALKATAASMDTWKTNVESENKIDTFISFAWKRGGPIDTMARITFWAAFFSLFSIIATIAAIRSLSITFGGDIEIAGLTRLI